MVLPHLPCRLQSRTTAKFLGSWWSASESRYINEQRWQFFAALTGISTMTPSLILVLASAAESGIAVLLLFSIRKFSLAFRRVLPPGLPWLTRHEPDGGDERVE